MKETIYTIPVTEAFSQTGGCPFCRMYDKLEENEIDRITGASMMEPAVRIETNKKGFCTRHYQKMFAIGRALPTALILESFLDGVAGRLSSRPPLGKTAADAVSAYISERLSSCYVCDRIDDFFDHEADTFFLLYKNESDFRRLFEEQKNFCLPHTRLLLEAGKKKLSKKEYPEFAKRLIGICAAGFAELKEDVSWFCKKFDYRYQDADWKNSKDSVKRSIKLLTSKDV